MNIVTNQKMIRAWLKAKERTLSYIAKHAGIDASIMTRIMSGRRVATRNLIKIAEFTGLPLRITCDTCRNKLKVPAGGR